MIVITNRERNLVNVLAAFDGRDAIAPPGHAPYKESAPQKANAPGKGAFTGTTGTHQTEATSAPIVSDSQRQRKAYLTMQAEFARVGYELKSKHHPAGLTLFEVTRYGQTRIFSAWHDVGAFLTQLQGVRHG